MSRRVLGPGLWLALLTTVQACAPPDAPPPPSGRAGIAYIAPFACNQAITKRSPPGLNLDAIEEEFPNHQIIGGVAALETSSSARYALPAGTVSYQTGPRHLSEVDPTLAVSARVILLVRRGAVFELRISEDFHDRAAFEWGSSRVPAHRLAVGPCGAETEWLFVWGRVFLPEPECVAMEVALPDGAVEPFQMGIGEPCPGQLPPLEAP